jgi:hypothetical protein
MLSLPGIFALSRLHSQAHNVHPTPLLCLLRLEINQVEAAFEQPNY